MPSRALGVANKGSPIPGGIAYSKKVLGLSPIAYWMLNETAGVVAVCQVNAAQNGTFARNIVVMGTAAGIGDGNTAPNFDGINDYVNIHTAAFAAAFNGAEGSMMAWARVSGAGVWTDGVDRRTVQAFVNANNVVQINKLPANNQHWWRYRAGGVATAVTRAGANEVTWLQLVITWSAAANQMIAYLDGIQEGAIQVGLGVWAGALSATRTLIGANNTVGPANLWDGYIAHVAFWDRPLTPSEARRLAKV